MTNNTWLLAESPSPRTTGEIAWTEWAASPYHSTRSSQKVEVVILHFTAGPRLEGTVNYFKSNSSQVSAHFVVGKDGRTVQMVPLDRAAHHAGKSALPGIASVNRSSIGIEIVNWGKLRKSGTGFTSSSFNERTQKYAPYAGPTPVEVRGSGGSTYWEPFTDAQYVALSRLLVDLVRRFPTIKFVTGHEHVAIPRGRKPDPGPAFDWSRIRRALPGFTGQVGALVSAPAASSSAPPAAPAAVSTTQTSRVVEANRRYGETLGWSAHYDDIARVLGFTDMTPGEELFAEALATWQARNGLTPDGLLGPRTWAKLKTVLGGAPAVSGSQRPSAPSGGTGTYGRLRAVAPGKAPIDYQFTQDDEIWLARMLVGEASGFDDVHNHAVVWAMFNRYALLIRQSPQYSRTYPTFHQFIRAYSTTLQPCLNSSAAAASIRRNPNFVPCAGGGTYKKKDERTGVVVDTGIPRGQLRRHLDIQASPWTSLPGSARSVAARAVRGALPNPIGNATEFASTRTYFVRRHGREPSLSEWRSFTEQHARNKGFTWIGGSGLLTEQHQMRKNTFFVRDTIRHLPPNAVVVVP